MPSFSFAPLIKATTGSLRCVCRIVLFRRPSRNFSLSAPALSLLTAFLFFGPLSRGFPSPTSLTLGLTVYAAVGAAYFYRFHRVTETGVVLTFLLSGVVQYLFAHVMSATVYYAIFAWSIAAAGYFAWGTLWVSQRNTKSPRREKPIDFDFY